MRTLILKIVAALFITASLGACAQGARTNAMIAPVASNNILPAGDPMVESIKVGAVTGGQETSPLWVSEISSETFKSALEQSLRLNTILGDATAPFTVDAELIVVEQPLLGISMTVTTTVAYKVTNAAGTVTFDEKIVTPYTAAFSDAYLGTERLRLANEGSAKANIAKFIDRLISTRRATS